MTRQAKQILAYLRFSHWRLSPLQTGLLVAGGLTLTAGITAFGTAADTLTQNVSSQEIVESLQPNAAQVSTEQNSYVREERIRSGDTLDKLLKRLGVTDDNLIAELRDVKGVAPVFTQLSPAKVVSATVNDDGQLQTLTFPLNGTTESIVLEHSTSGFKANQIPAAKENQVEMKSGEINSSLFGATDAANIPDAIATQLVDIFGGDIDFHRDLRKGDRFSVAYESITSNGKPLRTGRILAAEFINDGKRYRAVWFANSDGQGGYYTPDGKSFRKAFLRSPLEFSRVTSGFSSARFHPVLQTWRAHKGVDYAAAVGTRVKATADGVVEFAGTQGGYGRVVILKHQGRYSTVYGHLSAFAPGLKVGKHVNQGDVIALSGATGLASGPHLHYEFRIDGIHQNPLTVALPGTPPLTAAQTLAFHKAADAETQRLDMLGIGHLSALE